MQPAAGATGEHHVGPAPRHHARGLGHGQQARHIAEHDRVVRPAGIVGDGDVRRGHVGEMLEQPERMHLLVDRLGPAREIETAGDGSPPIRRLEIFEVGIDHVAAEGHAEPLGRHAPGGKHRVGDRQIGRRKPELNFTAHHLQALPRPHIELRLEVGNLAAKPHLQ
jgi:hypothetical protein